MDSIYIKVALRRITTVNTRTVLAESSKFASFLFDQGFQIVVPPRIVPNVPELIKMPSDGILH